MLHVCWLKQQVEGLTLKRNSKDENFIFEDAGCCIFYNGELLEEVQVSNDRGIASMKDIHQILDEESFKLTLAHFCI